MDRVAIARSIERGALREMGSMASHAKGSFLMNARDTIEHAAAARCIGVPGISSAQDVVQACSRGLLRIRIRRDIVHVCTKFVLRMAGTHRDPISSGVFQNARSKFVTG